MPYRRMSLSLYVALVCSLSVVLLHVGCRPADPPSQVSETPPSPQSHAHSHAMPASYDEAIEQLRTYRDEVKEAFTAGQPEQGDEALHQAVHVLEHLPELAQKAGLNDEQLQEVKSAAQELFEAMAQLHEGLHQGQEGAEYEDVAPQMESALQKLDELRAAANPATAAS